APLAGIIDALDQEAPSLGRYRRKRKVLITQREATITTGGENILAPLPPTFVFVPDQLGHGGDAVSDQAYPPAASSMNQLPIEHQQTVALPRDHLLNEKFCIVQRSEYRGLSHLVACQNMGRNAQPRGSAARRLDDATSRVSREKRLRTVHLVQPEDF